MTLLRNLMFAAGLLAVQAAPAVAQVPLYAQRLPDGTVYIRLANALPDAATIKTDFAGSVDLGGKDAARISPYFVAGSAGGKMVTLAVTQGGKTTNASFTPPTGSFVTVVLQPKGGAVDAAVITDKPEYNQLRARLSFYNATPDCAAGSLAEAAGRAIFNSMAPDTGQARSINPVAAKVVASCAAGKAPVLDLGQLDAGGLYTVWMMRGDGGAPTSFLARDTIAPPRN